MQVDSFLLTCLSSNVRSFHTSIVLITHLLLLMPVEVSNKACLGMNAPDKIQDTSRKLN